MKTLRKDSGGYALLYVLIIVVVLCAIAAAICTVALRNYQEQARAVAQTRQLYQAEGEVEKFVALAEDVSGLDGQISGWYVERLSAKSEAEGMCRGKYLEKLENSKNKLDDIKGSCIFAIETGVADLNACQFTLTYQNNSVEIETTVGMKLEYEGSYSENGDGGEETYYAYTAKISKATPTYLTYTISHLTAEGGEGHETE